MSDFILKWQSLIGALVGAGVPFALFLLSKWYFDRKEYLSKVHRIIVVAINNLIDIDKTVRDFSDTRLVQFIARIEEDTTHNVYSLGLTYFPLFAKTPFPDDVINSSTMSGYVDNKIIQLFLMSKDFALGVDDIKRQFEGILEANRVIALEKANAPVIQNESFRTNVEEYRAFLERDFFGKNVPVYLKALATGGVALLKFKSFWFIKWNFKFRPDFKYFKDIRAYNEYIVKTQDRIDLFLKKETEAEVERLSSNLTKSLVK